jgi:hypothetical protein
VTTAPRRQRLRKVEINRRLAAVERLPGLDPKIIDKAKEAAVNRMAVVDRQNREWRELLNRYPHQTVASYAEHYSMRDLKRILAEQFPGA